MPKVRDSGPASKKAGFAQRYAAPALEKGLDILELFAREPGGLNKSEVARQLNRTNSEVFRMLVCLEHRGYITHDENEKYRLTLRLFELGQQHPPTKRLISEATPILSDIAHATVQTCFLAVIEDGEVAVLAQAEAPLPTGFFVKPGSRVGLLAAASGYVILAHQDFLTQAKIIDRFRQRGGKLPADFTQHIERIRKQGYEQCGSYQVEGVTNISFPILDVHGAAVAALTMPVLPRLDQKPEINSVIDALRKGARQLSLSMGSKSV